MYTVYKNTSELSTLLNTDKNKWKVSIQITELRGGSLSSPFPKNKHILWDFFYEIFLRTL